MIARLPIAFTASLSPYVSARAAMIPSAAPITQDDTLSPAYISD